MTRLTADEKRIDQLERWADSFESAATATGFNRRMKWQQRHAIKAADKYRAKADKIRDRIAAQQAAVAEIRAEQAAKRAAKTARKAANA